MLPPNTTSVLQPMNAGIIAAFKCRYKRCQLQHAIRMIDMHTCKKPYAIDQLTVMTWCRSAWEEMIPSVIRNCWKHTGIVKDETLMDKMQRLHLMPDMSIDRILSAQI